VTISLANDQGANSIAADLDVEFPTDLVEIFEPATENCVIAERLESTHEVLATLPPPGGLLRFTVTTLNGSETAPLGDGELATCNFHILEGVEAGTAALTVEFTELRNVGGIVPSTGVDGAIIIEESVPTPTATSIPPTATNTVGVTATHTVGTPPATATHTVGTPPATATHTVGTPPSTATHTVGTQVATATHTVGPPPTATRTSGGTPPTPVNTPTRTSGTQPTQQAEDDGCNIAASDQSSSGGTLMLLLAPALLIWARRRRF
jgi:MYXO-CTERM domain-containing protein